LCRSFPASGPCVFLGQLRPELVFGDLAVLQEHDELGTTLGFSVVRIQVLGLVKELAGNVNLS